MPLLGVGLWRPVSCVAPRSAKDTRTAVRKSSAANCSTNWRHADNSFGIAARNLTIEQTYDQDIGQMA